MECEVVVAGHFDRGASSLNRPVSHWGKIRAESTLLFTSVKGLFLVVLSLLADSLFVTVVYVFARFGDHCSA